MVRGLYLIKAQFLSAKRYKIDFYGSFFVPLLTIIPLLFLYYLGSKSNIVKFFYGTSNTTNIFGYLALGAAYWNYVEILWGVIFTLRRYMRIGQFEEIFLTPVSGLEYILSWSVFGISRVTIESVPILILALLSNLLTIKPLNLLLFICSFVISIIASFGFVFLFFGLTLLLKDADELVSLVGNAAPLIGGMFFPVTVLPKFLRYVSYVFPFTWGLDLSRHFLMGTKTIFDFKSEFMIFTVISFLYIIAGYLSYVILQHKARQKGVHGF